MATMSICSTLDPLQNLVSVEAFPELHTQFLPGIEQSVGFSSTETCIDPPLELEDYSIWNGPVPLYLSSISSPDNYALPDQDLEYYNPPKRQKIEEQLYSYSNLSPNYNCIALADSYGVLGSAAFPEYHQSLDLPVLAPQLNFASGTEKKHSEQKCLSPQSIAARQRRRKIAEKTEELGNLIPGGCKMSTAEMLQAAYKYVKFLQAQVGILQLLDTNSTPERSEGKAENLEEIQSLLACPRVQGKLSTEEKCLVKNELVEILLNDQELQEKCNVDKQGMDELIRENGWCP